MFLCSKSIPKVRENFGHFLTEQEWRWGPNSLLYNISPFLFSSACFDIVILIGVIS